MCCVVTVFTLYRIVNRTSRSAAMPYPEYGCRRICRHPCGALVMYTMIPYISMFRFVFFTRYFIKNISRTSAVSSTNFRSILIFASCVVGTHLYTILVNFYWYFSSTPSIKVLGACPGSTRELDFGRRVNARTTRLPQTKI